MGYKYLLFDLDGTLTDPGLGITNGVMYALEKFNIDIPERTELYKFIGPPLKDSFMDFYGMSEEDSELAVKYYREQYIETGLYENEVYEGIEDMLSELKKSGKILLVATSKPEIMATRILEHFGLDKYFDYIGGSLMTGNRDKKAQVIEYVLGQAKVTDLSQAVMIGDRKHDIIGAKENKLDSVGVLYGYGDREELEAAGANYIAATPKDILGLV